MNCKYYTFHSKKRKLISWCIKNRIFNPICDGCKDRDNKQITYMKKNTTPLKKVSKKQAKSERERKSVFTNDLTKCIECPNEKKLKVSKHEIFRGRNRQNSMKYDLVIPLCLACHDDPKIEHKWQIKGQKKFEETRTREEFISIFKRNYL